MQKTTGSPDLLYGIPVRSCVGWVSYFCPEDRPAAENRGAFQREPPVQGAEGLREVDQLLNETAGEARGGRVRQEVSAQMR